MVIINLKGMDEYHLISKTKELHPAIASIYNLENEEDLLFYCEEGFVAHNGVDQTSFVLLVYIDADIKYKDKEKEVIRKIKQILSDTAIHFYFRFTYKNENDELLIKDPTYPLYMKDDNMIKVEHNHDHHDHYHDNEEEPFMGNVISEYEKYVDSNPNATPEELYKALMDIKNK